MLLGVSERTKVMDSARDVAAASDAVISPRLWATCTLRELCPIGFKPGIGEAFEGPFAESFEPSDKMEKLLVQRRNSTGATVSGRSTICFPAVVQSVHRRNLCNRLLHRKHWWKLRSYYFGSCMHVCCNKPPRYHGLWHDRRFASQQLEHSSEEPVQQAPPMNVGESFAATALVHVCMCGLVLSIKFHHITCF